jgi:hypothetical protein
MNDRKVPTDRQTLKSKEQRGLSLSDTIRKAPTDQRGSDPYNTSGSFDRKKNWARVGKR